MASFQIELLSSDHDRAAFDCGSEALNQYLRQTARQHNERWISRTFVYSKSEAQPAKQILGYFTLCICEVDSVVLPELLKKRLPRRVGALKLARLAVAKEFQEQGIGGQMLASVFRKFVAVNENVGGVGIFVDAKDYDARRYYERFQFEVTEANDLVLFLPVHTIRASLA